MHSFIKLHRALNHPVTTWLLLVDLLKVFPDETEHKTLNQLKHYIYRFLNRESYVFRRGLTTTKSFPTDLKEKVLEFYSQLDEEFKKKVYSPEHVMNLDETGVFLNPDIKTTITFKGEKWVKILCHGQQKLRVSVVLCATASGKKLPPMVIFKSSAVKVGQKRIIDDHVLVEEGKILVDYQESAWNTTKILTTYLNLGIQKQFPKTKTLLVLDKASIHTSDEAIKAMNDLDITPVFVPSAMTPYLQPLDFSINKVFKEKIVQQYTQYVTNSDTLELESKPISAQKMIEFISEACYGESGVKEQTIRTAFTKTGVYLEMPPTDKLDCCYEENNELFDEAVYNQDNAQLATADNISRVELLQNIIELKKKPEDGSPLQNPFSRNIQSIFTQSQVKQSL